MRLFLCLLFLPAALAFGQTDSVIVSGQVRRLSAKLYRQSPQVVVGRTLVFRANTVQNFPGLLQPDGRFRVAVPIIYLQEEMQFRVGNAQINFLASAGSLTVELDNDSLYVAAVPFRFGGVNAQVNQQFAQFKAFDAAQKTDEGTVKRAIRRAVNGPIDDTYSTLYQVFTASLTQFSASQSVFPLVRDWVQTNARNDAAAYVFDKAVQEQRTLAASQFRPLLTGTDALLTASRATALSRLGAYASWLVARQTAANRNVPVRTVAQLLTRYANGLTPDDRARLAVFGQTNAAKVSELRYLARLLERNTDTISRLLTYETALLAARPFFDTLSLDYLKGYSLASATQTGTLAQVGLFGNHITPQIGNTYLRRSAADLAGQALQDTALVRQAWATYLALEKKPGINSGFVSEGVYVYTGTNRPGAALLRHAVDENRGKVLYMVLWSATDEAGQQLAREAQPLRDVFGPRDLTTLYVSLGDDNDDKRWLETIVRNRLRGEHVRLSNEQANASDTYLNLENPLPVRLFGPQGKLYRKEPATPNEFSKLVSQIQELLR